MNWRQIAIGFLSLNKWRLRVGEKPSANILLHLSFLLVATATGTPGLTQAPPGGGGGGTGGITSSSAPPADRFVISPGGVDMRTGRYAYSASDLQAGGERGLELRRILSSAVPGHVDAFANLTHNWEVLITEKRVDISGGNYIGGGPDYRLSVYLGGRAETFDANSANATFEQISNGGFAKLSVSGDRSTATAVYTYQGEDGTLVTFRPIGSRDCASNFLRCAYATQVVRPDGTVLTLQYEDGGSTVANMRRLRSVTSSGGYALILQYGDSGGSWHHVSKACIINTAHTFKPVDDVCPVQNLGSATYSYVPFAGSAVLGSAANVFGQLEQFTYSGSATSYQMGFVRPGEGAAWLTNSVVRHPAPDQAVDYAVASQTFVDGAAYSYAYRNIPGGNGALAGGSYTDAAGAIVHVNFGFPLRQYPTSGGPPGVHNTVYQVTPGPQEIIDQLGRRTTADYCDPVARASLPPPNNCIVTVLQNYVEPAGNRTDVVMDRYTKVITRSQKHPKPGSSLADLLVTATYLCSTGTFKYCTKPTSVTDARGGVTDYTYSSDHGGMLTETGPAVNGVRPQKRFEYVQRYAWLRNAGGGYSAASAPIWVLLRERQCRTTAASGLICSGGAVDEVVTEYDYGPNSGPNNLLVRGVTVTADGQILRTCYGYDAAGRKISETRPGANLAVCS